MAIPKAELAKKAQAEAERIERDLQRTEKHQKLHEDKVANSSSVF